MGNFGSLVIKGIKLVGKAICKIVSWFVNFLEEIAGIVKNFLHKIKELILSADEPEKVGKCANIKKHKIELEKKEKEIYEKLSDKDKEKVDSIDYDL